VVVTQRDDYLSFEECGARCLSWFHCVNLRRSHPRAWTCQFRRLLVGKRTSAFGEKEMLAAASCKRRAVDILSPTD
jgi:hypothetical protein